MFYAQSRDRDRETETSHTHSHSFLIISLPRKTTGFKLRFSFHNKSTRPQQAPSGRWNCSVPHWHQFRQHFACDLIPQCSDGRDEAPCPYTSPYCGVGFIALGESCYQVTINDSSLTPSLPQPVQFPSK